MPKKRQLAAIMFTDIEGYTALMQGDEAQAIYLRETHRKIFNSATEKFEGKVLQYYGDGTLSIFDSAIDAINCAIEMQLAFRKTPDTIEGKTGIPVRIGIHSGDIIFSEEEIIGDSVNIASRVESLALAGSVFISDKVFDEIKNQVSITARSMGEFELKNVKKSMEVFAIANEGLVVPDPKQIHGKARRVEPSSSFFQTLWRRGQPQLITGYFAGIWGLVGFTDWVTNRYNISSHWTDVLLVFFLTLIPVLLVYVWNIERIKQGHLNLFEKLLLPGNIIASIFLLSFLFKGTDLGGVTQTVQFDNENGIQQFKEIIKPGFRKKLAVLNFLPEKKDSNHLWMSEGIHIALAEDMAQNEYLTIGTWSDIQSLQEMLSEAKENSYEYCLTGDYSLEKDSYKITSKLYETQTGVLKQSHTYSGQNFFSLIDTIGQVAKKDIGISQTQINQFIDLPLSEAFTSDITAYQNFSKFIVSGEIRYLEEAIAIDSTFAIANYVMAQHQFEWSSSVLEAKEAISQGMRHRKRLPERWETRMKTLYFQINDEPEKAIALLKMQLEIDPGNQNLMRSLTQYLFLTGQYKSLLNWRRKLAALDSSPKNQVRVIEALMVNARFEEAEQLAQQLLKENPHSPAVLANVASVFALTGQLDKANAMLDKVMLWDPEIEAFATEYAKAFQYAKLHPQTAESLVNYAGFYRLQRSAAEYDIYNIKDILYGKGREFMGGFFFIPSGRDEFMMGGNDLYEKWTFVKDSLEQVYKIKTLRVERNGQIYHSILWRQDSLITKAMGLFALDKKEDALPAFKTAFKKNPQHFYLAEYIKHLEFILNPAYKTNLEDMRKCIGNYGPRHIWMENEKFYYRRDGYVGKQQLLPIAPNLFYFYGSFEYYMEVDVKNGVVKGTVSWEYDNDSNQFIRDDQDYIAFDKFMN